MEEKTERFTKCLIEAKRQIKHQFKSNGLNKDIVIQVMANKLFNDGFGE